MCRSEYAYGFIHVRFPPIVHTTRSAIATRVGLGFSHRAPRGAIMKVILIGGRGGAPSSEKRHSDSDSDESVEENLKQ